MKTDDLKSKTKDELAKMLVDMKKQQLNLRFQKSQGQLENTAQINSVRRDIARVKTFMALEGKSEKAQAAPKAKKAPKSAGSKKTAA